MRLVIIPLICLCTLLSSCIDGEEDIWVEKDGSGRIEATYKMPPSFMAQLGGAKSLADKLSTAAEKDDSLTITALDHGVSDGRAFLHLKAEFSDLRELAKFPKRHLREPGNSGAPGPEEALFGEINLKLNGLLLEIYREVDLTPILPESARNNPAALGESTFRYSFHLPVAPAQHDAHQTSDGGKTLTWSFLLREHTTEPMTIWARAPLPIPWWVWFSGILVIVLFILLIIWAVKYSVATRS